MGIRVSVVIPAYNATKTIHDGLDAFAKQSFPAGEVELIIVDDESTDGTPEYIERHVTDWGAAQPKVRVLRQAHRGPAAARNLGAEAAQGEFPERLLYHIRDYRYLLQFHGFNCLKKSLPLSSTRINAGKSSTSIFQIASIPSSGYSTHSMLLILFCAKIAAGPPIEPR